MGWGGGKNVDMVLNNEKEEKLQGEDNGSTKK